MATEVLMPKQGQSVETCLILEWKKKEGDPVQSGETLCVVETDKATFDVEAPESGVLLKTDYPAGEDVPVLERIAVIGQPGEQAAPPAGKAGDAPPAGARPAEGGPGPAAPAAAPVPQARDGQAAPAAPKVSSTDGRTAAQPSATRSPSAPSVAAGTRHRASPRARKLAELRGLPLEGLSGTGPRGRIMERDVRRAAEGRPPAAGPVPAEAGLFPGPVEELPLRGVRKVIAARMLQSITSTAQYTLHASASAEALLAYRERLKNAPESLELGEINLNDLVMYAVGRLLPRFRDLNSHFPGDRILRFEQVHLGFAVDTPKGLMVPVIRRASLLSLRETAREARRLRQLCLEEKIGADDLSGATFTVSNLGALGVESFTPILNPPQVAILGVGGLQLKPVQQGEAVAFVPSLSLSLTANHQVVDGAPAARFLKELREGLERFELLLAD